MGVGGSSIVGKGLHIWLYNIYIIFLNIDKPMFYNTCIDKEKSMLY
jgi:hypothetical protein